MLFQWLGFAQSNVFFLIVIAAGAAMLLFYLLRLLKHFGVAFGAIFITLGLLIVIFRGTILSPLKRAAGYAVGPLMETAGISGGYELLVGVGLVLLGFYVVYQAAKW